MKMRNFYNDVLIFSSKYLHLGCYSNNILNVIPCSQVSVSKASDKSTQTQDENSLNRLAYKEIF